LEVIWVSLPQEPINNRLLQETQLSQTNRDTRLQVSQGHQTITVI